MKALLGYMNFAKAALTLAAVAALVIFFWPGALVAVTGFAVLGFSIASIVGPSLLLQTGAVALAVFAGLHVVGLAIDALSGLFSLAKQCFCAPSKKESEPKYIYVNHSYGHPEMSQNQRRAQQTTASDSEPPKHVSLYPDLSKDPAAYNPENDAQVRTFN
ncbi:MAG: hypothetical protein P4L65_10880 [Legionella sp.]|nr:hypothetical protein [Legionella sp.]